MGRKYLLLNSFIVDSFLGAEIHPMAFIESTEKVPG